MLFCFCQPALHFRCCAAPRPARDRRSRTSPRVGSRIAHFRLGMARPRRRRPPRSLGRRRTRPLREGSCRAGCSSRKTTVRAPAPRCPSHPATHGPARGPGPASAPHRRRARQGAGPGGQDDGPAEGRGGRVEDVRCCRPRSVDEVPGIGWRSSIVVYYSCMQLYYYYNTIVAEWKMLR